MKQFNFLTKFNNNWLILSLILFSTFLLDLCWLKLDNSSPAWDQSAHLTSAMGVWKYWQTPDIFNSQWWLTYWQSATSYRGPLVYLLTVPFFNLFGVGYHQGIIVNFIFTPIIVISVYSLGKHLFSSKIGLTASILCLLFPSFVFARLDYLIDYGLVAFVIINFTFLTFWKNSNNRLQSWLYTIAFGFTFGLIMLAKITGFFFIFFPGIWFIFTIFKQKKWEKLLQCLIALIIAWLICGNWYQYNWLTIITTALSANAVGKMEGDPPTMSLSGWFWYLKLLPNMISLPFLILPMGIGGIYGSKALFNNINKIRQRPKEVKQNLDKFLDSYANLAWIFLFVIGSYILCSFGTNKDSRFIMPYLTGVSLILAYLLNIKEKLWLKRLQIATLSLGLIFLIFNIFPFPFADKIAEKHLPYQGKSWHQEEIIQEIIKTDPYLKSTIGIVAKNTEEINHFTMDYYGRLQDFQVYSREIASSLNNINKDLKALTWYLTRSNEPNPKEAQIKLQQDLENNPEIDLFKSWTLPDNGKLNLYHRKNPFLQVKPLNKNINKIELTPVNIPLEIPQGFPFPITYKIEGNWQDLKNGLLILTWEGDQAKWTQDHGIGMGQIYQGFTEPLPTVTFKVMENIATFPPATLPDGNYTLKGIYLNRQTGENYDLKIPEVTVKINHNLNPIVAPELDWVTQFSVQIIPFSEGKINQVIEKVGVLNFYDPIKDYLKQAEISSNFRLQTNPNQVELWYNLALAQAMQTKVNPLLQTLENITKLDAQNPYAWTYLAFVRLYNFQPKQAEIALNMAEKLENSPPEIKTLKAISSLMQLNLLKFWQEIK